MTGVRGRHLPAGGLSVDVARQATIRRSKLGDISGIVSTERRKRDRTS